jgi:Ca-activated chloride channel family protein
MKLNLRALYCAAVLFWILSNQIELIAAAPQTSPGQADLQFFLTALAKNDSPAILQDTALSVRVDKAVAQVKGVRSVKDDPLLFAVVVDVSRSDASTANSIKEAAFQLFQGLAVAQNQGYLVLFNHTVAMSQAPISASEAKKVLDLATFSGGTAVYDAIEQTSRQKLSRSGNPARSRRLILLISDGEDNQSHVTNKKAEQAALEEGVAVFSVVTKGSMSGPQGEKFLKEVSQVTGGFATDKDLKRAVSVSLAAVEAQWAVTLVLTQSADRNLHSMQIKCTQRDVRISAPSGVFVE